MTDADLASVRLSNLDRVLWPATGFTKGDLVDYYTRIGPMLVRHVAHRPLMLGRWPEGVDARGWGQWECRGHPPWMATAALELRRSTVAACLVNDLASLVWVANQGVIELHPYLARADAFDRPLSVVFDLDPGPPAGLRECCQIALRLRAMLERRGLQGWPKTSGGEGLHVIVPLNGEAAYPATKAFARAVAAELAAAWPDRVTDHPSKARRGGRVFVDWAQNDERKQTVAVYSLRATTTPCVSTPVSWDEVVAAGAGAGAADSLRFTPAEVLERSAQQGDLFEPVGSLAQELPG